MPITTLSKGYKKPSNPTYGSQFFPAMEENIQLMNDHTHNGTDGAQIAAVTGTALAANWGADLGGGTYRQVITLPGAMQFDSTRIEVRRSTGEMVYARIEKVTATTFYLYTNDNTVEYDLIYV